MSNQPDSHNPDDLCVLNDVRFFDLATRHWIPASQFPTPVSETFVPRARYAHLSSVTADRLFIIGGQDFFNTWLDDICVYDLLGKTWVQRRDYPRHCGTYRSVAVASNLCVRRPQDEKRDPSKLGAPGTRFRQSNSSTPTQAEFTPTDSLVHLPYSTVPTEDFPSDIYLYSNYNFTDVKRELEVFSPLPDTDFTIQERSSAMSGTTFPPGLRFPTGAILGTHLIIAGTYLAHTYQSFSIWVLDLLTMTWSRIDPGKAVETGSWFRGCLWGDANKFLIFGNRNGNLVDDYNRRLLSWDHVAVIDLEAFGIYQPPSLKLSLEMQEVGLAALEEGILSDFEIICDDGRKIGCSRKLLEERWPWFKDQLNKFSHVATETSAQLPTSLMHVDNPILPGATASEEPRPDPRLTPRSLHLSEPYPITLALVRYFYTLALLTPLQLAPAVLSQLLVLATNYRITHLESLVKHAMHRALSNSTSVGVYEVATLCGCRSLQIRALKTVMSYTQRKPTSKRSDKENGSGGRPPDGGSGGGPSHGNEGPGYDKNMSRPRGASDARWRTVESDTNNGYTNPPVIDLTDDTDSYLAPTPLRRPPRNTNHRNRALSVVSITTDQELRDVADLIEPMINIRVQRPSHDRARSDDDLGETVVDPVASARSTELTSSWVEEEEEFDETESISRSSTHTPSLISPSVSTDSQYDLLSPDGRIERVYLPPSPRIKSLSSRRPSYVSDVATDVSDVPSLLSSTSHSSLASSKGHSPPTPHTIVVPPEYLEPPLGIIEEKRQEEQHWSHEHTTASIHTSLSSEQSDAGSKTGWTTQKATIEWSITRSTTSFSSGGSTHSPDPISPTSPSFKGVSFSRFLKRDKADNHSTSKLPLDKALKADEKKRKKEAARIQTERLAQDLKKRQETRKRAQEDSASLSSTERKKKQEGMAMYGGMAGFTM
ncbi:hypothetical protein AAF712_003134 [Marasmius tenuissimus]|uniref:Uncharacterized protein n=1 Tax=Marasmius tenuissimus TaxID=585030 RepID=A0ABR3AA51_9AGAR